MARHPRVFRRRRQRGWKARFWFLILGIILGTVLGIALCFRFNILPALESVYKNGEVLGAIDILTGEKDAQDEQITLVTSAPLSFVTAQPAETEAPADPAPTPVMTPTSEPTPTPVVETSTPAPTSVVTPTPEPTPTPQPTAAGTPTPRPIMTWAPQGEAKSAEEMREAAARMAQEKEEQEEAEAQQEQPVVQNETEEQAVQAETPVPEGSGQLVAEGTVMQSDASMASAHTRTEPCQLGEWFAFETEVNEDGTPYYGDDGVCHSIRLAMRVTDYLSPEDYAAQYGEIYQLYGSEAAIVLEIRNDSDSITIIPQDAVRIAFANKSDVLYDAYPLMDAPMAGSTGIRVAPGETVTVYKRFAWSETTGIYPFLTVTYMVGGETCRSYYLLDGME